MPRHLKYETDMQITLLQKLASILKSQYNPPSFPPFTSHFIKPRLRNEHSETILLEYLIKAGSRTIVVGSAGTGKTKLFQYLANHYAVRYLKKPHIYPCPLLLYGHEFRRIAHQGSLLECVAGLLSQRIGNNVVSTDIEELFEKGRFILLIDGLDEILSDADRTRMALSLNQFSTNFEKTPILLSSRPIGLTASFANFRFAYLSGFEEQEIHKLIRQLAGKERHLADRFINTVYSNKLLSDLTSNPLLLSLLWSAFEAKGTIPDTATFLYTDLADYLLSTWDRLRGIGPRASLTLSLKHEILESISVYLFQNNRVTLQQAEAREIISAAIGKTEIEHPDPSAILEELTSSGILRESAIDSIHFIHLSFLEYYIARAVSKKPSQLITLLSEPKAQEIIVFACGLINDIAPLIEAAIERRLFVLAAKCISHGRTVNKKLTSYVVQEFVNEIGEQFINLLVDHIGRQPTALKQTDIHLTLIGKWNTLLQKGLPSNQKGRLFEEFSTEFFGQVFKVVKRDLHTKNGELDLVLENTKTDPFWTEFGGDIFVECKGWGRRVPLKEVGAFAQKVAQSRNKLGFFVSISGFTKDAKRTIESQASNTIAPLIVPIDGTSIESLLTKGEYFEEFFKDRIRDIKYLRKF